MMRPLRAAGVSALLALLVALAVSPARGQDPAGAPPRTFEIATSASALLARVSVPVAFPLGVDHGANVSSVRVSSIPLVVAEASLAYAPLAVTAAGPTPAFCTAYYPGDVTETSCGGPTTGDAPVGAAAASGRARASGDTFEADGQLSGEASTKAAGLGSSAGAEAPLSVGSVATAARSGPEADKIVAGAAAVVSDIDIAGVLHIDSVRSSVSGSVSARPGGAAVSHSLVVEGATVAGQRVRITPDGVEADDQASGPFPLGDAQTTVNEALAAAGLVVRLVPPDEPVASDDGQSVSATSGGLGFSYRDPTGTNVYYLFGQSTLQMFASRADPAEPADAGPVVDVSPAGDNGTDFPLPGEGLPVERATAPPPPEPGAGIGRPSRAVQTPVISSPTAGERTWRIPYPPFALLVVSLPLLSVMRRLALTGRGT